MKISREEVEHVAALARLRFAENEIDRFADQLNSILGYMAQLEKADTGGVEPTFHAVAKRNAFRDDTVRPSPDIDRTLANSPDPDRGFFRVPKIIE